MATKLNKNEREKKVSTQMQHRFVYLIKTDDKVSFIPPKENHANRWLFHHKPLVEMKEPSEYFIPAAEYEKIQALFNEFRIPERTHADLIYCWLNMVFAKLTSTWQDDFYKNLHNAYDYCYEAYNLIRDIADEKLIIKRFSITTKERKGKGKFGSEVYHDIQGHIAANFLMDVLKAWGKSPNHKVFADMYERHKEQGHPDMTMGHKNSEAQSISYYAHTIFQYSRNAFFEALPFEKQGTKEWADLVKTAQKQLKIFSKNKRYIFIGRLMMLAGLIEQTQNMDDNTLRDRIKKHILPLLQAEKKRNAEIDRKNREAL